MCQNLFVSLRCGVIWGFDPEKGVGERRTYRALDLTAIATCCAASPKSRRCAKREREVMRRKGEDEKNAEVQLFKHTRGNRSRFPANSLALYDMSLKFLRFLLHFFDIMTGHIESDTKARANDLF